MLSKQVAKQIQRRELEYIAVQATEELVRLEQYNRELYQYIRELERELDEIDKRDDRDKTDKPDKAEENSTVA